LEKLAPCTAFSFLAAVVSMSTSNLLRLCGGSSEVGRPDWLNGVNRRLTVLAEANKAPQIPHQQIVNIIGLFQIRASTISDVTPPGQHCGVSRPRAYLSGRRLCRKQAIRQS
jgi:hypothetical protein